MQTTQYWKIIAALLLSTAVLVHCQDEDDDDEEASTEEDTTTSTASSVSDATSIIEDPQLNVLIQEAISNANRASASTTVSPQNGTQSGNGSVDAVVLNALVNAALVNANRKAEQETSLTMSEDELIAMMRQMNKILNHITKGNVIGIVKNALKVRAPPPVQNLITDTVKTFVDGRTAVTIVSAVPATQVPVILPPSYCNCPVKSGRAAGSAQAEMEYIMNQLNKILENVATSNMTGIVDNALKIKAPESVQAILTNTVKIFVNGGGVEGLGLSAYSCPCSASAGSTQQNELNFPKPIKASNIATFSQNRIQQYKKPNRLAHE